MDLVNLLMGYAAKRGTYKLRGFLEKERHIDIFQLFVSLEIPCEPAHNTSLLRLGEAPHTIVNTNENNFALLREVEVQAQIVPCLDNCLALLPAIILDKRRCHVCD